MKVSSLMATNLCTNYQIEKKPAIDSNWRKATADDFISLHLVYENGIRGVLNLQGADPEPGKFDLKIDTFCDNGRLRISNGKCSIVKENSPHVQIVSDDFQTINQDIFDKLDSDHTFNSDEIYEKIPLTMKQSLVVMAELLGAKWQ